MRSLDIYSSAELPNSLNDKTILLIDYKETNISIKLLKVIQGYGKISN